MSPAPAERVTLDPVGEDPTLQPLDLVGTDPSWGIYLLSHEYPAPKPEVTRAGSVDTEGDVVVTSKYGNRMIGARLRLFEPEDPAAVNLVPNPSAEVDTTGYAYSATSWTESAMSRVASGFYGDGGDYAIRLTAKKDNTATQRAAVLTINTPKKSVLAGEYISISVPVNVTDAPAGGCTIYVNYYTEAAALISTSAASAVFSGTGQTRILLPERLAPANCSFVQVIFQFTSTVANDTVDLEVDSLQVERGKAVTPYFDGNTPGCDWTGALNNSTSSRPAPDGTRFSRIYRDVTERLDRIKRTKRGTLRRIAPGFSPITFDLRVAELADAPQDIAIGMKRAEVGLGFEALPGGRGPEVQIGGNFDETSLPVQQFLAENVPGEMLALGRLQVEDLTGQAQLAAWWGLQQQNYSASVDAALFYEAESRTPLGSAATAVLTGASGAGSNTVLQGSLVNAFQGVLSTQASGGGNHLAHVGSYRVLGRFFRPTTNTGQVTARFTWTEGDFVNTTDNDDLIWAVEEREGIFTIEDMGIVTINQPPAGTTPRWEGRILGKSTVSGDDLYVDWLMLIPTDEGSGEARASSQVSRPAQISAFDAFDGVVGGNLAGKTAGIGGVWAGAGDVDDFQYDPTNHRATRTALSDASNVPRYETLGTTKFTDIAVKALVGSTNPADEIGSSLARLGIMARYVDTNNWLCFYFYRGGVYTYHVGPLIQENLWYGMLLKKVAGVVSVVSAPIEETGGSWGALAAALNGTSVQVTLELIVLANGEWRVGVNGKQKRSGVDTALNSTGALKEGLVGLSDEKNSALAETRFYDSFEAWVPVIDRSINAGRMLELDSDRIRRQDTSGVTWGIPPYEGDFLMVPPAGPEKRVSRIVVKASRNPDSDAGIDDLRSRLFVTPRYLEAPPT